MATGYERSCAVLLDGSLQCWGAINGKKGGRFVDAYLSHTSNFFVKEDGSSSTWNGNGRDFKILLPRLAV
ncbi:hypothetical protein [Marinagarivorans cellulosilyticus]|uniref:hypothetical protein n=1 Tax=Marinagarivorans cellulosilyticus TaxID=2721545 RepID=UPI003B835285